MADVSGAIVTRLTAHSGTNALIAGRAWIARLPDNPTMPAVTVQKISGIRTPLMGADAANVEGRVQLTSWATTRAGAQALDEQVRAALQRWGDGVVIDEIFLLNEFEAYEDASLLWRVDRDVRPWWRE